MPRNTSARPMDWADKDQPSTSPGITPGNTPSIWRKPHHGFCLQRGPGKTPGNILSGMGVLEVEVLQQGPGGTPGTLTPLDGIRGALKVL